MVVSNRTETLSNNDAPGVTLDFHLLGVVGFHQVQDLQLRLVAAASTGIARSLPILLCEHPNLITVGRSGSRAHIRLGNEQLQRRNLSIEWSGRGGGCLLHTPGQLCIYPIVPLRELGWSVGEYMRRLQQALMTTVSRMNLTATRRPESYGVWGQSGQLAALGVKVQDWVAHYGAFLNVCPDMSLFGYIDTCFSSAAASPERRKTSTMSCLMAERRGAVRMSNVRTSLIECLSETWGVENYHIHAGHPWLPSELSRPA